MTVSGTPAPAGGGRITVYSRSGCHLCEEALAELAPIAAEARTAIDEVDIEQDDALHRAHLERIPVVLVDGVEICTFFVEHGPVRAALGLPTASG